MTDHPLLGPAARDQLVVVAWADDHKRPWAAGVPLDADHHAVLDERGLRRLVHAEAETVFAIVDRCEPTATIGSAAPYRLTGNGALQPGG